MLSSSTFTRTGMPDRTKQCSTVPRAGSAITARDAPQATTPTMPAGMGLIRVSRKRAAPHNTCRACSFAASASAFEHAAAVCRDAPPDAAATSAAMHELKSKIEQFAGAPDPGRSPRAREVFFQFRAALTEGKIRAAERSSRGWVVNTWVKRGILLG